LSFLRVEHLTCRFGGIVALQDVSFTMEKGEILGLMGANGAGKTTLLSLIAGNVRPSGGHILLEGERIEGRSPHRVNRLGVSRTFQIVRPFSGLTVLENVMVGALFGRGQTMSQRVARAQCLDILNEVGLADRRDLPASALTLAGRKRLEVARALATQPRLLLLDEVLAGLNASEANDALDLINRLRESRMLSIVVIEHIMKALMRLSHRILVLHDGKKVMEGTPEQVASDPRVIAAYLGEDHDKRPS
jgi:branched-chain amino acid transport system ATP-binding protein